MKRKSTNNLSTFISSIMILLLVIFAVGFLFYFTNNFTTELKNFYVKCGSQVFVDDCENLDITLNKQYKFSVVNTLGGKGSNYIVSIVPNETSVTSFVFKVDNQETNFCDVESLIKGFSIVSNEEYFTLTATKDLQEILQLYYPTQTITDVPTTIDTELPYFKLVVSSSDMTETININFNIRSEM